MIGPLLEAVAGRVAAADAVLKSDDTLTVTLAAEGETRVSAERSQTGHLRVVRDGRVGTATGDGDDPGELAARALESAALGESLGLLLPAAAPLPEVVTRHPGVAAADAGRLGHLARVLADRLARSDRRIEAWAERSTGVVRVANTRAVMAGYETTLAGAGVVVESIGAGGPPPLRLHVASAALPDLGDLEGMVAEAERRLAPPIVALPPGFPATPPVCLAPRAFAALLRPVLAALRGREALLGGSPFRGRLLEMVLHPSLTLMDDPLAPERPGSRPIDDDGVPSRRLPLIEAGRLMAPIVDLALGARAGVPATGHAWRGPGAVCRVGFTNVRVMPGDASREALLAAMGTGILLEELPAGAGPNRLGGAIRVQAPWAYLVMRGEVQGRLEGVRLSGNVFEVLQREVRLGSDAAWIGARSVPSAVVTGLVVRTGD